MQNITLSNRTTWHTDLLHNAIYCDNFFIPYSCMSYSVCVTTNTSNTTIVLKCFTSRLNNMKDSRVH